jgi:hypothetical protein
MHWVDSYSIILFRNICQALLNTYHKDMVSKVFSAAVIGLAGTVNASSLFVDTVAETFAGSRIEIL